MADSTTNVTQLTSSQAAKETTVNALFDAASPALLYGRNALTTTALTWGYYGGRFAGTSIANGTVALTGSNTNYVVAARSTGAVTAATATTNWDDRADYLRLYKIVAGASTITSYEDHREPALLAASHKLVTEALLAGGTLSIAAASAPPASASATGTAGTITWDANYLYVCVATDTWVRAAIATW